MASLEAGGRRGEAFRLSVGSVGGVSWKLGVWRECVVVVQVGVRRGWSPLNGPLGVPSAGTAGGRGPAAELAEPAQEPLRGRTSAMKARIDSGSDDSSEPGSLVVSPHHILTLWGGGGGGMGALRAAPAGHTNPTDLSLVPCMCRPPRLGTEQGSWLTPRPEAPKGPALCDEPAAHTSRSSLSSPVNVSTRTHCVCLEDSGTLRPLSALSPPGALAAVLGGSMGCPALCIGGVGGTEPLHRPPELLGGAPHGGS